MTKPLLPESRNLTKREWLVLLAFIVSHFVARHGLKRLEPGSLGALGLALLPVPFFAWVIWGFTRMVREMDELGRRMQLEALAIAFPAALLIVFLAGVLDLAGFHGEHDFDLPRLWPMLLFPYFFGLWRAKDRYS